MNHPRTNQLSLFTALGALFLALAGCRFVPKVTEIDYDFNTLYDFGKLETYAWVQPREGEGYDPFAVSQVEALVHQRLQTTGYRLSEEAPDFVVTMRGGRDRELGEADGAGRRQLLYKPGQSSLVIEFLEGESRESIWRGSATREIEGTITEKKRRDLVNGAATKILRHFPARPAN